jgi:transposase
VSSVEPPYERLALLVVDLAGRLEVATTRLDEAADRIATLEAEVAALRARLGKDSTNSSVPPLADSAAAKAKRKAVRSQRERSQDRKRGGQVGRQGSGLIPTQDPDRTERLGAPADCGGCGSDLADGVDVGATWGQVWDISALVRAAETLAKPLAAATYQVAFLRPGLSLGGAAALVVMAP